jgi:hypothetical protein
VKAASGTSSAGAVRRSIPSADVNAHQSFSSILAQKYFASFALNAPAKWLAHFFYRNLPAHADELKFMHDELG